MADDQPIKLPSMKRKMFTGEQLRQRSPAIYAAIVRDLICGQTVCDIALTWHVSENTVCAILRKHQLELPGHAQRRVLRRMREIEGAPATFETLVHLADLQIEYDTHGGVPAPRWRRQSRPWRLH